MIVRGEVEMLRYFLGYRFNLVKCRSAYLTAGVCVCLCVCSETDWITQQHFPWAIHLKPTGTVSESTLSFHSPTPIFHFASTLLHGISLILQAFVFLYHSPFSFISPPGHPSAPNLLVGKRFYAGGPLLNAHSAKRVQHLSSVEMRWRTTTALIPKIVSLTVCASKSVLRLKWPWAHPQFLRGFVSKQEADWAA